MRLSVVCGCEANIKKGNTVEVFPFLSKQIIRRYV